MVRAASLSLSIATLCVLSVGCTETVRLSRDPLEGLVSLEVAPGDAMVAVTDLAPPHHTLQYLAIGTFEDSTRRDVTPLVEWTIDNAYLGAFDGRGLFTASHQAAGHGTVTIEARGLAATGALTVVIDATIIDPTYPPPSADLFAPEKPIIAGDPTSAPALIYPADGTMFPESIARTLFQYRPGAGNDAFRLVFESDVLRLVVESGADRWQADGALQRLLAATGIAGPIRVEVQATSSAGMAIYAGNRIAIEFSPDAPSGPIFFWSAATNGIMRGGVELTSAAKLYPESSSCVGCHAIKRDASEMVMAFDRTTRTELTTIDLGNLVPRIYPTSSRLMGWATYSPDGTRLVAANNGLLTLYDTANGASFGSVPLPPLRYATHPDWSPDGRWVAVALTPQLPTNRDVRAASIARIPYNAGAWGTPEILVSGSMTSNNYFPKFSPDGKYIAFVRSNGASQGAVTAELMIVPSAGGSSRTLQNASRRVGMLEDVPDLGNTMPSWSPRATDGRAWLAFVSQRPYGAVLPSAGRGQIWVTSLDLSLASDPSTAAFWLPCQDVTVLNNNPVWSASDSAQ